MKIIGGASKQYSATTEIIKQILNETDRPLSANDITARTKLERAVVVQSFKELGNLLACRLNANSLEILSTSPMPDSIDGFHRLTSLAMGGIKFEAALWIRLPLGEKVSWYRDEASDWLKRITGQERPVGITNGRWYVGWREPS